MPHHFTPDEVARRLYVIRTMAAVGKYQKDVAATLGVSVTIISRTAKQHGIVFKREPNHTAERRYGIIRTGYELGQSIRTIAAAAGMTPGAVSVIASRLRLTRQTKYWDRAAQRRGFDVPENMALNYRRMRYLGLTTREAGVELGLLRRGD